jgi:hypothetical protein
LLLFAKQKSAACGFLDIKIDKDLPVDFLEYLPGRFSPEESDNIKKI